MAFDKVIDSEKLDGAITATANAIREKAESTEKLEWNIETGFAEAVSAITVDPTKVTILREQSFTGFVVDPTFGAYSPGYVAPALFQLENGKTYHVEWDGTEYECVAYSYSYGDATIVAIGNGGSLGLPSNGEPFLITYNAPYDNTQMFSTEATDSHTVGIWQKAESGGGSSADVRYVTFMNDDGTVELGKKAVATGDDCADPIARGVFSTPTKESTAQYNYTFYGWATTPNGAADSNWNKAVTEDRTVYANFISAVRYYTITYYDSDGTTVLKTESLAYGAMPNYEPKKDGYNFDGWNPALSIVTGNENYTAQWVALPAFEAMSWREIAAISESGNASKMFAIGQTKTFDVTHDDGTPEKIEAVIIGFDHDDLSDGTGKAGITMQVRVKYNVSKKAKWNIEDKTANGETGPSLGGWNQSYMRNSYLANFISLLPTEMSSVIKTVNKLSDLGGNDHNLYTTQDKLWLLSNSEIFGADHKNEIITIYQQYQPINVQGNQYEYYAQEDKNVDDLARSFFEPSTSNGEERHYWLRTTAYTNRFFVFTVTVASEASLSMQPISVKNAKNREQYVSFGFCI